MYHVFPCVKVSFTYVTVFVIAIPLLLMHTLIAVLEEPLIGTKRLVLAASSNTKSVSVANSQVKIYLDNVKDYQLKGL